MGACNCELGTLAMLIGGHVHSGRVPVNGRIHHNHPEFLIDGSDRYADRLRGYQSILRIIAEVSGDQHPLFMIFTCL